MIKWMDAAVEWVQSDGAVKFPGIRKPACRADVARQGVYLQAHEGKTVI